MTCPDAPITITFFVLCKARKSHFFFPLSHLFLQLKDSNEHLLIFQRCLIMFSTIDLKISKKAKNFSLQTKWVSFEKPFKIKYHRQKKLEVINNARLATSIATHCLKITSKKVLFYIYKIEILSSIKSTKKLGQKSARKSKWDIFSIFQTLCNGQSQNGRDFYLSIDECLLSFGNLFCMFVILC